MENKQIAEQQAKQAKYDADKAQSTAVAEVNRARGQAEAQRLLAQTVDARVLQLKAIEKWNGAFPQVMGTSALPFINIDTKVK